MRYRLPGDLLDETFAHLRHCGAGVRECQALWVGPWSNLARIQRVVRPDHRAHAYGFDLDKAWLARFWFELAANNEGVRVQVHTHPGAAFHSATDDAYPIVQTAGFLSLVIPNFAMGPVGFGDAYLTEIQPDGRWAQVDIAAKIEVT